MDEIHDINLSRVWLATKFRPRSNPTKREGMVVTYSRRDYQYLRSSGGELTAHSRVVPPVFSSRALPLPLPLSLPFSVASSKPLRVPTADGFLQCGIGDRSRALEQEGAPDVAELQILLRCRYHHPSWIPGFHTSSSYSSSSSHLPFLKYYISSPNFFPLFDDCSSSSLWTDP